MKYFFTLKPFFIMKNHHAGSAMFLVPSTTYELRLNLIDADGGSTTETRIISTKTPQQPSHTGTNFYVSPGNGGGNGSITNPFLG